MLTYFLLHDNSLLSKQLCALPGVEVQDSLEFALACQVVVFNLVGSVLVVPLSLISAISNEWLLATPMCIITGSI